MSQQSDLILLIRHGQAQDAHPLGDESRALTAVGRSELRAHAEALASLVSLKGIVTSPLIRAVQTAEILALAMGVSDIEVRAELDIRRASPKRIETLIREYGSGWAFVGHNPSMSASLAHLVGQHNRAGGLRNGAVAALSLADRSATLPWNLAWLLEPGNSPRTQISAT